MMYKIKLFYNSYALQMESSSALEFEIALKLHSWLSVIVRKIIPLVNVEICREKFNPPLSGWLSLFRSLKTCTEKNPECSWGKIRW